MKRKRNDMNCHDISTGSSDDSEPTPVNKKSTSSEDVNNEEFREDVDSSGTPSETGTPVAPVSESLYNGQCYKGKDSAKRGKGRTSKQAERTAKFFQRRRKKIRNEKEKEALTKRTNKDLKINTTRADDSRRQEGLGCDLFV